MPQRKPRRHPGTGLGTRYGCGPSPSALVGSCVPHITARFPAPKVLSAKFAFWGFSEVRRELESGRSLRLYCYASKIHNSII
jgi:hypothetical protein